MASEADNADGEAPTNLIRELLSLVASPENLPEAYERVLSLLRKEARHPAQVAALHGVINHAIRDYLEEAAASIDAVVCSFCQLPQSDVAWLIEGPRATICDQCATTAELYISRARQGWLWRLFNGSELGSETKVRRGGKPSDKSNSVE